VTTQANVVVSFPPEKIVRVPVPESMSESVITVQRNYLNFLVDENATILISRLAMAGVDVSSDEFQKFYALTIECLRSSVYKTMNFYHSLQLPMEDIIQVIENTIKSKNI